MLIAFISSIIILLIGIIIYYVKFKKQRKMKNNIFYALLIGILMISILIFPLEGHYKNIYTRILASFFYAIKCAGMGQELDLLSQIILKDVICYCYFIESFPS